MFFSPKVRQNHGFLAHVTGLFLLASSVLVYYSVLHVKTSITTPVSMFNSAYW